jgi:DNA primase
MVFDALKYLRDFNIPHWESGKNVSIGWVGISCPICQDLSSHGGINLEKGYYSCWLCGGHSLIKVIRALEGVSHAEAKKRIEEYQTHSPTTVKKYTDTPPKSDITFPIGTSAIKDQHKRYLQTRGFNPDEILEKYHILGTGPVAFINSDGRKINYSNRIIIPIIYQNRVVSYQGRDITGQAKIKYIPCLKTEEVMHMKHILYNLDNCGDTAVIMEGVLDVWRWGDGGLCTFGIQYTDEQLLCLLESGIRRVVVMFDFEPQAQRQAKKLVSALKLFGVSAQNYNLGDKDPAELSEQEVWQVKMELGI